MADQNQGTADSTAGHGADPAKDTDPSQTPKKDPKTDPGTSAASADVVSKEAVEALLAKVRSDEKSKVYGQISEIKSQKEAVEKRASELEKKIAELEADLDGIRRGDKSEMESIAQELAKLRDTNSKLEKAIEHVAEDATLQIKRAKLDGYREKIIAEKRIVFTESVTGDTEEEILRSATLAAEKQKQIEEEARKRALEEARKAQAKDLPKPLAVDGQLGRGPDATPTGPASREALAALPREEYLKKRAELLQAAKQRAGLIE